MASAAPQPGDLPSPKPSHSAPMAAGRPPPHRFLRAAYGAVNRCLGRAGLRLIKRDTAVDLTVSLANLRAVGVRPAVVFDIGVAAGTPDLYAAFPEARFHLIDPLPASLPHMRHWATKLDASIRQCALGAQQGEGALEIREDLGGSTLYEDIAANPAAPKVTVPVRRFDELFGTEDLKGTTLVKIDVQGAELDVLRGMGDLVADIDVFVVEVSLLVAWHGAPHMDDVVGHLKGHGFVVYDICGIQRRPLDNALAQLDLMLCQATSPLVAERRWSR